MAQSATSSPGTQPPPARATPRAGGLGRVLPPCARLRCRALTRPTLEHIASDARADIESWGIAEDEDMCTMAAGYVHERLTEAGYDGKVLHGYVICDRPPAKLRSAFFEAGRRDDHVIAPQHTWNVVDDTLIDVTASQFNDQLEVPFDTVTVRPIVEMSRHTMGVEIEPYTPPEGEDWPTAFRRKRSELDQLEQMSKELLGP